MTDLLPPVINIEISSPVDHGASTSGVPRGSTQISAASIAGGGRGVSDSDPSDSFAGMTAKERRLAQRRCIAEDKDWNLALVEKLSELCLRVIVANFEKYPKLDGIPAKHRERVLSSISTSLPLSIVSTLIPDESYWKRRATSQFKNCDPNNTANLHKAIGNGIGGFGGGLMGIAPLTDPSKIGGRVADTDAGTAVKPGLSHHIHPVASLEDVWMGFGAVGNGGGVGTGGVSVGDVPVLLAPAESSDTLSSTLNTGRTQGSVFSPDKGKGVKPMAINAGKWKTLFFELHVQNLIEGLSPKKIGGLEEIVEFQKQLRLAAPFLRRLDIRQLKPTEPLEGEIVKPTDPPADHLDISMILNELIYLRDLKIYYGVRDCGIDFSWRLFGMTLQDCQYLSNSLRTVTNLETLIIQASGIDDDRARLIENALLENKTIKKLDLSHNKIGNGGARGIAKVLASPKSLLTHLDISNNQITQHGAHCIGKALQLNSTLIHLNMRMNRFGDEGGADFLTCLAKTVAYVSSNKLIPAIIQADGTVKSPPQYVQSALCSLDLASNGLGMDSVQAICVLIKKGGKNLRLLDLSCNKLGDYAATTKNAAAAAAKSGARVADKSETVDLAGKLLFDAVSQNKYITHLDLRVTDLSTEHLVAISGIITDNQGQ